MPEESHVIISIKPQYAEAIISGKKTVELRRRIPTIVIGARLWIYATKPIAAIIGYVTLDSLMKEQLEKLWEFCGKHSGLDRCAFDTYFDDVQHGIGMFVSEATKIEPIDISTLRGIREGFHPPQVMFKITPSEVHKIKKLITIKE